MKKRQGQARETRLDMEKRLTAHTDTRQRADG